MTRNFPIKTSRAVDAQVILGITRSPLSPWAYGHSDVRSSILWFVGDAPLLSAFGGEDSLIEDMVELLGSVA